jgi:hypothetical protein
MGRYTNCKCDACGKRFTDDDDVVICPECGTPQHRACYEQHNACIHADLHASGYEWKREGENAQTPPEGGSVTCARCGAQNAASAATCQVCGAPMPHHAAGTGFDPFGKSNHNSEQEEPPAYSRADAGFMPDFSVDGVTSREIADYIGPNSPSFIPKFNIILQRRASFSTWNIPALIFGPFYYIYRKIYKVGTILLLLLALIYVPGAIYSMEYFKAALAPQYFGITLAYNQAVLDLMQPIAAVASYLRIALHIYCCTQANTFFLDRSVNDILDLHKRFPENERGDNYRAALSYCGRPATGKAIGAFILFFGILYGIICMQLLPLLQ